MADIKPLLSICIPTFNRSNYLERCLESIVHQDGFDDRIEIIISDNCSTDGTPNISRRYTEQYKNIRYFVNEKNVLDGNYPIALQRANGILRKLSNDSLVYKSDAIKYMLQAVEENKEKRPQIYFLSSGKFFSCPKKIENLEEYITSLAHNLTWIGGVAIWDDDCDDLSIFINNASSQLGQVPFLLENFEKRHSAVIYDKNIMNTVLNHRKDLSYGLYKIFYTTFLGFIKPYLDKGKISKDCYEKLRETLLFDFFGTWIVNFEKYPNKYFVSEYDENLKDLIENEYRNEPYFGRYKRNLLYNMLKTDIKKIIKKLIGKE